jgi:hypothetical protein
MSGPNLSIEHIEFPIVVRLVDKKIQNIDNQILVIDAKL